MADGPSSWLRVTDDGIGMSSTRLDEAMRYGNRFELRRTCTSVTSDSDSDRFVVAVSAAHGASRSSATNRVEARQWDLDEVLSRNSWDLRRLTRSALPPSIAEVIPRGHAQSFSGERLDRVLPAKPTDGMDRAGAETAVEHIRQHLAMVFHRFLDGEAFGNRERVTIVLNGEEIQPWDPFARHEAETQTLPQQSICISRPRRPSCGAASSTLRSTGTATVLVAGGPP